MMYLLLTTLMRSTNLRAYWIFYHFGTTDTPSMGRRINVLIYFRNSRWVPWFITPWIKPSFYFHRTEMLSSVTLLKRAICATYLSCYEVVTRAHYFSHLGKKLSADCESRPISSYMGEILSGCCRGYFGHTVETLPDYWKSRVSCAMWEKCSHSSCNRNVVVATWQKRSGIWTAWQKCDPVLQGEC